MRNWLYSESDVEIINHAEDMALMLNFKDPICPSVELINSALRYVYCKVYAVHPYLPNEIIPLYYPEDLPNWLYRYFNLISSQDTATVFIWGSLAETRMEFPLLYPYSTYRFDLIAPSISDFGNYIGEEGWISTMAMTLFDVWLFTTLDSLTGINIHALKIPQELAETLSWKLFGAFKNLVFSINIANNTPAQFLNGLLSTLPGFMDEIFKDPVLIKEFVKELSIVASEAEIEAAIKNLNILSLANKVVGALNIIFALKDLLLLKAKGNFQIDVPLRRRPVLRTPISKLTIAAGSRTKWPLELFLPDGRQFSFTDEAFDAIVEGLGSGNQGFRFEEIIVYTKGVPETLPVSLVLESNFPDIVGVKPSAVNSFNLPGGYTFPDGLGRLIQGIAPGYASVRAGIELNEGYFPNSIGDDRICEVSTMVEVGDPLVKMKWNGIAGGTTTSIGTVTGKRIALDLSVELPFESIFNSMMPFTANVAYNSDYTWMKLSNIQSDGSILTYPFDLTLTVFGMNSLGSQIADFKPEYYMEAMASVGRIYFAGGLDKALRTIKGGSAEVVASLIFDESMDGVSPPDNASLMINVELGTPTLRVEPSNILIEDNLTSDFGITMTLPDGTYFSTLDGNIQAKGIISKNGSALKFGSILINPDADVPVELPIDIVCETAGNQVVSFIPDYFIGAGLNNSYFYGSVKDFIEAKKPGSDIIAVSGLKTYDTDIEFNEPIPQNVTVKVADPVVIYIDSYEELPSDKKPISESIDVWHSNIIKLYGRLENYSPMTTIKLYVNGQLKGAYSNKDDKNSPYISILPDPEDDSNRLIEVVIEQIQSGNNEIMIEASKAVNAVAGGPSSRTININGISPSISIGQLKTTTGKKTLEFNVYGSHALEVKIYVQHPDGTVTDDIPAQADEDGAFNLSRYVNLILGTNTIHAVATNGIASLEITEEIEASKPQLKILLIGTVEVKNGKAEIYESPVNVSCSIDCCEEAELYVCEPGNSGLGGTVGSITTTGPTRQVDFDSEGTYRVTVKGSNDFGEAEDAAEVIQVPSIWTINKYKIGLGITNSSADHKYGIIVETDDPERGISQSAIVERSWESREYNNCKIDKMPSFFFYTYEYALVWDNASNCNTWRWISTENCQGNLMIWGELVRTRNQNIQKYQIVIALKERYKISIIDPGLIPSGGWPNDGYVRFKNANIRFSWGQSGDDCYADLGVRIV